MTNDMKIFPGTFPGTIKAPLDVAFLAKSADVVCQGEVIQVSEEGQVQYLVWDLPTTFRRMIAVFQVDRIYKGNITEGSIEIEFLQADLPSSLESLHQGEKILGFLVRKDSRYHLANLTTSKAPINRQPPQSESSIPVLIKELDEPDPLVRYLAMMGLAEVTAHPEWGAAIDVFLQDEANYIGKWKDWWLRKQK